MIRLKVIVYLDKHLYECTYMALPVFGNKINTNWKVQRQKNNPTGYTTRVSRWQGQNQTTHKYTMYNIPEFAHINTCLINFARAENELFCTCVPKDVITDNSAY